MYQTNSSTSSSPIMSENTNLINSFIITNGLVSRLSGNETSLLFNQSNSDKNDESKSINDATSIAKKKPLKKLNNSTCEIQSDAVLLKQIPQLYERFIEVFDSTTKESCQMMMCKTCRFLQKKNSDILLSHLCKQKDIDKFSNIPIINNELIFRSKPKNRATPIWNEFDEVIEPASNLLLGYARCKRCLEIIKTSDPKSIPAVLRRHVPLCPILVNNPSDASSLLVTSHKSSSSENNNRNQKNNGNNKNLIVSNPPSSKLMNLNNQKSSAQSISSIKDLGTNNLLNAMKNLTNQSNNLNLNNLTNLNGLNNMNSLNSLNSLNGLNSLNSLNSLNNLNGLNMVNNNSNLVGLLSLISNPSNLTNSNSTITTNGNSNNTNNSNSSSLSSSTLKLNSLRNEFRERCIELCYKEMINLDVINSPSFMRLCKTLLLIGSNQSISNRQQIQLTDTSQLYNQLNTKFKNLRSKFKNDLEKEMSTKNVVGALVCDSQDQLSIMSAYFISNDWKLKEYILGVDAFDNQISTFITNTLNDYELNEEYKLDKFTLVSRVGDFDGVNLSLPSIAHIIDLIIDTTIFFDDTYTDIIENCRLVCNELAIEVKLESIIENVDWITKYEIMKNILMNKFELKNYPLNFEIIEFLINLLTPFRNAAVELRKQCSNRPTINHVLLWYYKLIKHLEIQENNVDKMDSEESENSNDELDDLTFVQTTKRSIRDALDKYFELHTLHKIAVFLWPNFRSLKMLTAEERNLVYDDVRQLIEARISKEPVKKFDNQSKSSSSKKARTDFAQWEEANPLEDQDEIQRYLSETLRTCDENSVLDWWRDHQTKFPLLSQLAKWILSIPASVNLIEKFKLHKNSKIDGEILFLHCNLFDSQQSNKVE